jgi:nucleoside-diphosphate-sugar epimerase
MTSIHKNVTVINCDLSNPVDINMLPMQMDIIIHMALSPSYKIFPEQSAENFYVNTVSTLHLLEYALKSNASHFVFTSTGGVYNSISEQPHKEDEAINLQEVGNFYYSTKLCCEMLLRNFCDLLNITVLRMFYVYGREQRPEMLIPRLINNVKMRKPIQINENGGIKINPIHVSDAAKAIWASAELKGFNTINIAGNEVVTIKQLSDMIGSMLQIDPMFEFDDSSNSVIGSNEKMKDLLIFPSVNLLTGISEMIFA